MAEEETKSLRELGIFKSEHPPKNPEDIPFPSHKEYPLD